MLPPLADMIAEQRNAERDPVLIASRQSVVLAIPAPNERGPPESIIIDSPPFNGGEHRQHFTLTGYGWGLWPEDPERGKTRETASRVWWIVRPHNIGQIFAGYPIALIGAGSHHRAQWVPPTTEE